MAVSNNPNHMFNAPIPGSSLTNTPGSSPWQKPPQFTDLHKALMYMWDTVFKDPETVMQILVFLKQGITITEIVNTFMFAGVAGSKWNIDIAMLMYPTVCHQLEVVAKLQGVKYTFKRVKPSTVKFVQQYNQYLKEPDSEPVKAEATKMFATGLGLDKE